MISLTSVSTLIAVNQFNAIIDRLETVNDNFGVGIEYSQTFQSNTTIVISTTVTINNVSNDITRTSYTTANGRLSTTFQPD